PYSNGKIEAKNTHIKTMKRVSYGFKNFRKKDEYLLLS
ncbi:transposase, partial [Enterococcus faecium]|nr:transposase [Enterococcus faecium]